MSLVPPNVTHVTRAKGSRLCIAWQMPDVELLTAYHFRIYAKEHSATTGKALHNWGFLVSTADDEEATNVRPDRSDAVKMFPNITRTPAQNYKRSKPVVETVYDDGATSVRSV